MRILSGVSVFVMLVFCSAPVYAQMDSEAGRREAFNSNGFGVGVGASLCSGMGLSLRHHSAKQPLAVQISGGVWPSKGYSIADIGMELQLDLSSGSNRLYALAALGWYQWLDTHSGAASGENFYGIPNLIKDPTRYGAGIGYESQITSSIDIYGSLMITLFEPSGEILPLPSLGMLLFFK